VSVDLLAIGAHPDDAELGIGGMIHKLTRGGHEVALVDLTRGEMGSRGSGEERLAEATEAARILGVSSRECVGLPDSQLCNVSEQQRAIIPFIRKFRPRILMAPMNPDRHPDHMAAHDLVRDANYFSGLKRIDTGQEPYRAPSVYYFYPYEESQSMPSFIIDVSDNFDTKLEALQAYASQFYNPAYKGAETRIASKAFWESVRTRAAYWGDRIGVTYGEPLFAKGLVGLDLPPGLTPKG
jgi:bacillithiol biosynthesis deacetylase BshB1